MVSLPADLVRAEAPKPEARLAGTWRASWRGIGSATPTSMAPRPESSHGPVACPHSWPSARASEKDASNPIFKDECSWFRPVVGQPAANHWPPTNSAFHVAERASAPRFGGAADLSPFPHHPNCESREVPGRALPNRGPRRQPGCVQRDRVKTARAGVQPGTFWQDNVRTGARLRTTENLARRIAFQRRALAIKGSERQSRLKERGPKAPMARAPFSAGL